MRQREDASDLEHHQGDDDESADEAGFGEHGLVGYAGGGALGARELASEEQEGVERNRRGHQADLDAPVDGFAEADGEDAAQHQPERPCGVEPIEPFRLVLGKDGGGERIGGSLHCAIAQRHDEGACIEGPVALCAEQDAEAKDMAGDGEPEGRAEADTVDQQRQENDGDGEGPEACAGEFALLGFRQPELGSPLADDQRAQNEAE